MYHNQAASSNHSHTNENLHFFSSKYIFHFLSPWLHISSKHQSHSNPIYIFFLIFITLSSYTQTNSKNHHVKLNTILHLFIIITSFHHFVFNISTTKLTKQHNLTISISHKIASPSPKHNKHHCIHIPQKNFTSFSFLFSPPWKLLREFFH